MPTTKAVVELRFKDGTTFRTWERFSLRESFLDPLGSFSFTARPLVDDIARHDAFLQRGSLVGLKINRSPIAAPVITSVRRRVDMQGVTFDVECKSVLVTPYEGSVDPDIAKHFNSDTPISSVVLEAMGPYGFDALLGDNNAYYSAMTGKSVTGKPKIIIDTLKEKDVQANNGETAYQFCARLFGRLGVALRVDHEGTLLLEEPDFESPALYTLIQSSKGNPAADRMLAPIETTSTNDGQFSEASISGRAIQPAPQAPKDGSPVENAIEIAKQKKKQAKCAKPEYRVSVAGLHRPSGAPKSKVPGEDVVIELSGYRGDTGTTYKPYFSHNASARDIKQCRTLAYQVIGARASQAFQVRCRVPGFVSRTGHMWAPNTNARVIIEVLAFDRPMWILDRTFSTTRDSGDMTDLTLIPKGSLLLDGA